MIELLFVACLSAQPDVCEERSMLYTDITPASCMFGAQPALATWVAGHPAWEISSWRCRAVMLGEKDV